MFNRFCFGALLLVCLALTFTGCNATSGLDSIQVTPATASMAVGGGTLQLTATGTFGNASHPTRQDITSQVTWTSSINGVATVNSSGVVTAVGAGTTNITASAPGFNGPLSASTTITVTGAGTGTGTGSSGIVSLAIIPASQSVAAPGNTSQFIAIGTTSTGATLDLTGSATWTSSSASVATICPTVTTAPCTVLTGELATAQGKGVTTITAEYLNPDKTVATNFATLTVSNAVTQQITTPFSISPNSLSLTATGQPGYLIALGTSGSTNLLEDVTDLSQVAWTSSNPAIATVCTAAVANTPALCATTPGKVTGVSAGSATITAEYYNTLAAPYQVVTAQASVTVTNTIAAEPLLSVVILPSSLTTANLEGTGQFLAYGTFSTAPTLMDITNGFYHAGFPTASCTAALAATGTSPCTLVPVNWISAMQDIFPVNSSGAPGATAGMVTAEGSGNASIYVTAQNPDGTLVYSPIVAFSCPLVLPTYSGIPNTLANMTNAGSCNEYTIANSLKVTLTVFNEGLNTSGWLITAPSATGTPDVIHCGPGSTTGGSVCEAAYPVGTTVTLTAPAETGVHFGGWSWNCENQGTVTAAGPNFCTVYLGAEDPVTKEPSSNVSVGAIFN